MAELINVLIMEPHDYQWYPVQIPNDLATLQNLVGGYIETYTLENGEVIICNEEGSYTKPLNINIEGNLFYGTLIRCKTDGEEFASIW